MMIFGEIWIDVSEGRSVGYMFYDYKGIQQRFLH